MFDRRKVILGAMRQGAIDAGNIALGNILRELRDQKSTQLGLSQGPTAWRQVDPYPFEIDEGWGAAIGSSHPAAAFREKGGTITPGKSAARAGPRRGERTAALLIPLPKAKTKILKQIKAGRVATAGGIEQFGPLMSTLWGPKGRRIFGKLSTIKTRKRTRTTVSGAKVSIRQQTGEPKDDMFLMARSVTVGANPYIEPALKRSRSAIEKRYRILIKRAFSDARKKT
jgi:hypothetical protein